MLIYWEGSPNKGKRHWEKNYSYDELVELLTSAQPREIRHLAKPKKQTR